MRRKTLGLRMKTSFISLITLALTSLITLALTASLLTLLTGCGGSSSHPVSVAVTASAATVDGTDSVTLTATVSNDKNGDGVSWSVSGGGTLSDETTTSAAYTAPAATASAQTVTVTATSVADGTKTGTTTLTVPAAPSITTTSANLTGAVGSAYSVTLAGSGGISPYTWTSSGLPSCLSLTSAGVISGTPVASCAGSYSPTFTLTDSGTATALTAPQTLSLYIAPASAITFTGTVPTTGTYNVAFTGSAAATGGAGTLTYSQTGTWPTGLKLNTSTGAISGTPAVVGIYSLGVTAADAYGDSASTSYPVTISYPALSVTTSTSGLSNSGNATYNVAYSTTLSATGGSGMGYTWTYSGSLPPGLGLGQTTGVISGTPNTVGTYPFTVKVTDSAGNTASASLSIKVSYAALTITSSTLPSGVLNTAYTTTLTATGGSGTGYTWTLSSGSLPAGLSLASSTGVISGTPTTAGTSNFTVEVTDSLGNTATSLQLSIAINAGLSITTNTTLPAGTVSAAYAETLTASGGSGSYTWALASGSSLPSWLQLTSAGVLSGTPTTATAYSFTITVTDSASNTASATFSLTINGALSITTTYLPSGTENVAYSQTIGVSGGTQPYTFSITSGSLPSWANSSTSTAFTSNGQITGTPTSTGSTQFIVQVTDSASHTATQRLTITVYAASGVNNSYLKGSYAFEGIGWVDGTNDGSTYREAVIGNFVADGNGNITSGVEDINNISGAFTDLPFTGTYNIASNNTGFLTVTFTGGTTATVAVSLGGISSNNIATAGSFIDYDDTTGIGSNSGGSRLSGEFAQQTTSAFTTASLSGGYVFGEEGETCSTTSGSCSSSASAYGPLSIAGVATFSGSGSISSGEEDAAVGVTQYSALSLSGSYGTPNTTTGRVTATLNLPSGIDSAEQNIWPTDFVYYIVNSGKLYVMSTDSHASHALIAGQAVQQSASSFSSSNLSGNVVFWEDASDNNYVSNFGASNEASSSAALLLLLNVASGSVSGTQYQNSNGTYSTNSISGVTVSVASNGRVTLSGSNDLPVLYLAATNTGYGTETTNSQSSPGLLTFIGQSGSSFSTSTLSGNYYEETIGSVPDSSMATDILDLSSGNASLAGYSSESNGTLSPDSGTETYTVDSNGLIYPGTNTIGLIISASEVVTIKETSSNPTITVIKQ
jgi:hypothetical protein